jgi:predicted RNase H-like HicB family nuclease
MDNIKIVIEKTRTGCSAYVEGIKKNHSICSTGKDIPHVLRNLAEAWELYQQDNKQRPPKPKK